MRALPSFLIIIAISCVTFCVGGCSPEQQQQAKEAVGEAETAMEDAAGEVTKEAGAMLEQGKEMAGEVATKAEEMAGELSEAAASYLNPLKEKLTNLENLKETPEKLKTAVSELITYIEDKSAEIELPEMVSTALTTMKEKLVELQKYLEGEYEQSKIDEYLRGISDSVKSTFGM